MKDLRQVIRKLILESTGIHHHEVNREFKKDGEKRYIGNYAKRIFARKADFNYLNSLIYIHTMSFDKVDRFLASNNRNELSCIFLAEDTWEGLQQVPYDFGSMMGAHRVAFVIEGRPTWVQNKNAATGHTRNILDTQYGGEEPGSGVNKAPSRMFGQGLPYNAFDGVILDEDDAINFGLMDFDDRPNKNNEALIDNWSCSGIVRVVSHTDHDDAINDEYNQKIDAVIEKAKQRFPNIKVLEVEID